MKRRTMVALLVLPLATACAGGGTSTTSSIPQAGGNSSEVSTKLFESESGDTTSRLAAASSSSTDLLYVANAGNNSITVYHQDASGNATPLRVISGSKTGLDNPGQLSEDTHGNLYVANAGATLPGVLVFAHGASGNAAPAYKLGSSQMIEALTIDQVTGKLFVVAGGFSSSNLTRYVPNASGREVLAAVGGVDPAVELASDSTGKNLILATASRCCFAPYITAGIDSYAKQFVNGVLSVPEPFMVSAFTVGGVADDPTTRTYLVSGNDGISGGIFRLAEDTVGRAASFGSPLALAPPIASVLTTAANCGPLALGYLRDVYAICGNAIRVYGHDATGNVAPLVTISGPATGLVLPDGIYEGA